MRKLLILFLGIGILTSCKKKAVEAEKSTLEYLAGSSSKKWRVTKGTVKYGESTIDLIANQPPCITDNILVLNSNKSYELLEGTTKCKPENPDVILKANWVLVEDPKAITVDKFIFLDRVLDNPKFLISSIDDNQFVGQTEVNFNGKNYLADITFTAVK